MKKALSVVLRICLMNQSKKATTAWTVQFVVAFLL